MGALFGLLASLSITGGEVFGRRILNVAGPVVAASVASLLAFFTALVAAVVEGSSPDAIDMLYGGLSGLGFGLGISCFLTGLRSSTSAVVGPTVAGLAVLIPFTYSAFTVAVPGAVALGGAAAALVGLGLVTTGRGEAKGIAHGLKWGFASGTGYGIGTAIFVEATGDSGNWPVVSQRIVAFAAIAAVAVVRSRPLLPPRALAADSFATGVFAGASSLFLLAGLAISPAAASVTASLYPASSVVAGRALFDDEVGLGQYVGLAVVVAGIVAIVVGS